MLSYAFYTVCVFCCNSPKKMLFLQNINKHFYVVRLTAQLKCVYTNTRSMGNKQEELEANIQQHGYDLVAITET